MTNDISPIIIPEIVGPTRAWTKLRYHPEQNRLMNSSARFKVVPAGRRGGKTEIAKREGVEFAIDYDRHASGRIVFSAPTHRQAKKIYWNDLKRLVPSWLKKGKPSESELVIRLKNGNDIEVVGLDEPARIEGPPLDYITLDEYANMKASVWTEHVGPALADRKGKARFIGVPEGRNHYFRLRNDALADKSGEWDVFHWISADILDPEEIASAKRRMDRLSYLQEFEANFINFEGRAYHTYDEKIHAFRSLRYKPNLNLILTMDFNVKPGTANILQEQVYQGKREYVSKRFTACIDEIHIEQNSNTVKICQDFIKRYRKHKGRVIVYGDATGGAKGSAKVQGSDWDLVKNCLIPVFGDRLSLRLKKQNPRERVRLNAFNSRLMSMDGTVSFLIDPQSCPYTTIDLEGVTLKKNGSGELDKKADEDLTHHTDGIGYFVDYEHPLSDGSIMDVSYGM